MTYTCCNPNRRDLVDAHPTLNGIDWLEVLDLDAPAPELRQKILLVRMLKPLAAPFDREQVRIDGGERLRDPRVAWVALASAPPAMLAPAVRDYFLSLADAEQMLLVHTPDESDFSTYRLSLVRAVDDAAPPPEVDALLAEVAFSFKVECPADFDCHAPEPCPEAPTETAQLNYLARDFESIRRLAVDRLSQRLPAWRDRTPADLTAALTELIAYLGDLQHYQLDATTTEAYLATARQRISLRRHALLVDYAMHEGCNARTWVTVDVEGGPVPLATGMPLLTRLAGTTPRLAPGSDAQRNAMAQAPVVFETLHEAIAFEAHGHTTTATGEALAGMRFYTFGDDRCCLPRGATRATLRDDPANRLRLRPGDVLILQERVSPHTGLAADANLAQRHAVRLTHVSPAASPVVEGDDREVDRTPGALLVDPLTAGTVDEQAIVHIAWDEADALPFPLCISSITDEAHGETALRDVSIARGNVVLADHGLTIEGEALEQVPAPSIHTPAAVGDGCDRQPPLPVPVRYRPALAGAPVTQQGRVLRTQIVDGRARTDLVPFDPAAGANAALACAAADAVPAVGLQSTHASLVEAWTARGDLLDSRANDRHFVVEVDDAGTAQLRFGDGQHGRRPATGTDFTAHYRIGNGPVGNVGADSLAHAVTTDGRIRAVTNPLAAVGGAAPESAAQVRRRAPQAFRTQERAVTPQDYADMTERLSDVQRATARLRWTGSWHTVFTTVDRTDGDAVNATFAERVRTHLERYRMAGHDLAVREPVFVSLVLALHVCVHEQHFRSDVRLGLLDALSAGRRRDGTLGLFHPDHFSFGQTVYLSPILAAARRVPGVDSVQITTFARQGDEEDGDALAKGHLTLGGLEIARLANDPNFPEHGVIRLQLHGGK